MSPMLSSLLDHMKDEKKASLAVADPKLGKAIGKIPGLELKIVADSSTTDVYRAIREHLSSLIPALLPEQMSMMVLGLSHSMSRHKLKFSADKIDIMVVQAIALLDDLDKELNIYAMRVKEWYGWHFPEMAKIVNDNLAYAKIVLAMGFRSNAKKSDLTEILPEEIDGAVKAAAELSMGTEITDEDLENIRALAEQVVGFTEYRAQLSSYLQSRMQAIAPNLTVLVGELVGARLIAHAGSLMNLAKAPASTIQILGAEKALFRALKTKHDTPKYGLIYHASLIGQANGKNKGKIARMLATKAAIGVRVDALHEWDGGDVTEEEKANLGIDCKLKIERRLRTLEGKPLSKSGVAIGPNGLRLDQPGKWEIREARKYNKDADGLTGFEAPAIELTKPKPDREVPSEIDQQPESEASDDEMADASDDIDIDIAMNGDLDDDEEPPTPTIFLTPNTNGVKKPMITEVPEDEMNGDDSDAAKKAKRLVRKSKKESAKPQKPLGKPHQSEEDDLEAKAAALGLSVKRYKRKLERGEITADADGEPVAISKKDKKRQQKLEEKAAKAGDKRKREIEEDEAGRSEVKSKKGKKR